MNKTEIRNSIQELIASRLSLHMATASAEGNPCASYAPFVSDGDSNLCVYLSDLAEHTRNIAENRQVSAMLIEDEDASSNLFARVRLILECNAEQLERNSETWNQWLEVYRERFGEIVDTLVQLADFKLYVLKPSRGTYVRGFGQAYRIFGDNMERIEHIRNPARDPADE